MARNNPSNPYTRDEGHTQKDVPMPLAKAKVLDANGMPDENGFHTVRIRVYGDQSPYVAPVITPMFGSVWVPEPGTDVAVVFGNSDKPWVIGSWYPLDRVEDDEVDMPAYEPGDIRLGNQSGSHVTVNRDGDVEISGDTIFANGDSLSEHAQDAVSAALSSSFNYDDANGIINMQPHISDASAHHAEPSAGAGVTDEGSNQFGLNTIASGQVSLSSGTATVDTGVSATDATFFVALGVDDPNADVKFDYRQFWDDSAGTYKVEIFEEQTAVGSFTVNYDIIRVR